MAELGVIVMIKYFKSASEFRDWLEVNHARVIELWVGFFKKESGKGGLTYREALDEALCYGWIDGIKKRVDELIERFQVSELQVSPCRYDRR